MPERQCSLADIHRVELDILKFFKHVCEKNNIRYRLTYGTLLGAVRHNGFIPWDDDIDVTIPAEEIEKFMKGFAAENSDLYTLSTVKTEEVPLVPWLKIRKNHTASVPKSLLGIPGHWGIGMDIFPMFPVGKTAFAKAVKIRSFGVADTLLRAGTARYTDGAGAGLKILGKVPVPCRRFAVRGLLALLASGDTASAEISDGFDVFKRKDFFGEAVRLPFEDDVFDAPKAYDGILTKMYGDYMTLPPENERIGHDGENGEILWSVESGPEKFRETLRKDRQ